MLVLGVPDPAISQIAVEPRFVFIEGEGPATVRLRTPNCAPISSCCEPRREKAVTVSDQARPTIRAPSGSSSGNSRRDNRRVNSVRRCRHAGDQCRSAADVCDSTGTIGSVCGDHPVAGHHPRLFGDELPLVRCVANVLDDGVGHRQIELIIGEGEVAPRMRP